MRAGGRDGGCAATAAAVAAAGLAAFREDLPVFVVVLKQPLVVERTRSKESAGIAA